MATSSDLKVVADGSSATLAAQRAADESKTSTDVLKGYTFPVPHFAKARYWPKAGGSQRLLPQIIAHRGFKAKFPQNSLLAFQEAVKAGATALETDVHLTKDGVVVLSHNADLKRFGHARKIIDCTWDEINKFRTVDAPQVPMLRLQDLLGFILQPANTKIWLLLDIKADNNSEDAMRLIKLTIDSVQALPGQPWNQRILLGVWAARQIPFAQQFLPGFAAVHVGYHLGHAKRNIAAHHVGVVLLVHIMLAPGGRHFIEDCQAKPGPGPVIAWPVNSQDKAEWCVQRGLDGLVTDDPETIAKIWERFDESAKEPMVPISLLGCLEVLFFFCWINSMFWLFKKITNLEDDPQSKCSQDKKKQN